MVGRVNLSRVETKKRALLIRVDVVEARSLVHLVLVGLTFSAYDARPATPRLPAEMHPHVRPLHCITLCVQPPCLALYKSRARLIRSGRLPRTETLAGVYEYPRDGRKTRGVSPRHLIGTRF